MRFAARALALASLALLAACATKPAPPPETAPPAPPSAPTPLAVTAPRRQLQSAAMRVETGVKLDQPRVLAPDEAARALAAFRASCPAVASAQGHVGPDASRRLASRSAPRPHRSTRAFAPGFFYYGFDWVKVGDGPRLRDRLLRARDRGLAHASAGYVPIYRAAAGPRPLHQARRHDRPRPDRRDRYLRPLLHPRRDRGRSAWRARGWKSPGPRIRSTCSSLEIQGSGRVRFDDGTIMRDRLCRTERPRLCGYRPAASRPRHPAAGRRQHAGDQGLDPRQSRPGPRADAREPVLRLLQGADRARPARALSMSRSRRERRVAADPNYVPLGAPIYLDNADRPRSRWPLGRAGHRRRDQGPEPLRYLLGRRPGRGGDRRRHVGEWRGADPSPQGRRCACARLSPEEAELWARVAATIRPLSRERVVPQATEDKPETGVSAKVAKPRPSPIAEASTSQAVPITRTDARRELGQDVCEAALSSPIGCSTSTG